MRYLLLLVVLLGVVGLSCGARADAPATEFFAIETAKLEKAAPTDAALAALTGAQLSEMSTAHGLYTGGLSMTFSSATFRIDARFTAAADFPGRGPATIGYRINASNDQKTWSLLSVSGEARKQGKQYVTDQWRKQPVTVILRFLDLKQ